MEKPNVKIYSIFNGWLVEWEYFSGVDENEEDVIKEKQMAFTYDENQEEEKAQKSKCEALQDMFYFIKETLEEFYSKHNTWNLRIVLEKDAEIIDDGMIDYEICTEDGPHKLWE